MSRTEHAKPKVLFFLTYFTPHISGPVQYIDELSRQLAQQGFDVRILTSQHLRTLPLVERDRGVAIQRVPILFQLGKGVIMPALVSAAIQAISDADVVIVNLPQLEAGLIAIVSKFFNKPLIVIHHTDLSGWNGLWNRISEGITDFSGFVSCFLAKKILPYTKDYADSSPLLKKFKEKVIPLYPIIKTQNPDGVYADFLEKQRHGKRRFVGYSGRIAKQKKLEDAIGAIEILNKKDKEQQWILLLAGPTAVGEQYGKELLEKVKGNPHVVYLGPLNGMQLASFYKFIDTLVLPSNDRLESFGLVQVEAMFQGCPVVATNLPGARMPIRLTGMGELVPTDNPVALAEASRRVVSLGKEHWKSFIPRVKTVFDNKTILKNFLAILQEID